VGCGEMWLIVFEFVDDDDDETDADQDQACRVQYPM